VFLRGLVYGIADLLLLLPSDKSYISFA